MIVPFIATISREIFMAVPTSLKEAAMALGATHWKSCGWRSSPMHDPDSRFRVPALGVLG